MILKKNRSDLQIFYKYNNNKMITILIIENKSVKGDGYYDMLSQACKYCDNDELIVKYIYNDYERYTCIFLRLYSRLS